MSHKVIGTAKKIVMIWKSLELCLWYHSLLAITFADDSADPYDTDCINDPHTRREKNTIVRAAMSHPPQALCPKPSKEMKESREIVRESERMTRLTTETVQSAALSLEGIDNIE